MLVYSFRLKIIFFLSLLLPLSILAQKATGLRQDDAAYARQPLIMQNEGSKDEDLPKRVSLKAYCPIPRNQGEIQSCVGWSIGYGALTIERAIQNGWTNTKLITEEAFSALFIYNQIKDPGDCEKAASTMQDAVTLLTKQGICLEKEFEVNDCHKKPDAIVLENAKKNIIKDANALFLKDAKLSEKIKEIRKLLAQKKPVASSLFINKQFMTLKNKKIWYPESGDLPTELHAITIIGYDDNYDSGCFELLNSWGREWGDEGFIRIKYEDLAKYCLYAYAFCLPKKGENVEPLNIAKVEKPDFTPSVKSAVSNKKNNETTKIVEKPIETRKTVSEKQTTNPLVEMAGQFVFNAYKGQTNNGIDLFEPASVERIGNHYTLKKKNWKVEDKFQIVLTSGFSEIYMYVLSLNPKNEVSVLYPRDEIYNKDYKGLHESPLVMLNGARVILPNPQQAMEIEYVGIERFCILFSTKKINKLSDVCNLIKKTNDNFEKYIHELLGDAMIPLTDTTFEEDKIAFSTLTRSKGAIVPIIVEIQSK
jgi:hypothetical protein